MLRCLGAESDAGVLRESFRSRWGWRAEFLVLGLSVDNSMPLPLLWTGADGLHLILPRPQSWMGKKLGRAPPRATSLCKNAHRWVLVMGSSSWLPSCHGLRRDNLRPLPCEKNCLPEVGEQPSAKAPDSVSGGTSRIRDTSREE